MDTSRRASVRQVAEKAGVSRMTVSNVMNGRTGKVSPETLERVLQAARELEYAPVPQPTTQTRRVETRIIGLVFDQVEIEDPWGTTAYRGLRDAARRLDYDLLTILRKTPDWMSSQEELRFLDRRCDGLIFLHPRDRESVLRALVERGMPVAVGFTDSAPPGVAWASLDNAGCMRQAVEHLLELGHRKIVHLTARVERRDFERRLFGYFQAMETGGHSAVARAVLTVPGEVRGVDAVLSMEGDWTQAVTQLVEEEGYTAVVCSNDTTALQLMKLADERGWDVPGTVSVTGMDDIPGAVLAGLTTFSFSCEDMGARALEAVVAKIEEPSSVAQGVTVPVRMIPRETTGPPP